MEKQTTHPPLRWLLGLLLCCVAFGVRAQEVKIEGSITVGTYGGHSLFYIENSQITISSTYDVFNCIYIDGEEVAFKGSYSYWSSYSLDISLYLDGGYHKLQLERDSYNSGICYFTNSAEQVSIDGIEYGLTNNNIAAVIDSSDDIEEANIPAIITKDGIDYSVKSISRFAFVNPIKLHTVTIPESVTSIGNSAFNGCSALRSISIPESVTSIGKSAFRGCSALRSITIPESVKSIGELAFSDCYKLTTLNFNAINCESCGSPGYPAFHWSVVNLTIGEKVTKIPDYFLYGGSQIENLTIPNSVTSIGWWAFLNSSSLKSVVIPPSVTTIDVLAFDKCNNLVKSAYPSNLSDPFGCGVRIAYSKNCNIDERGCIYNADNTTIYYAPISLSESYELPATVTQIGRYAFYNCANVTSITIPESIINIEKFAFSNCTGLTKFYSYSVVPPICGDQALDDINKWECTLYVPEQSSDEYRAAPQWKDFFFIEESVVAGVGSVLVDNDSEMEVYDLQGRMVGTSLVGLKAGIYIVKQGGTTSKVAVN